MSSPIQRPYRYTDPLPQPANTPRIEPAPTGLNAPAPADDYDPVWIENSASLAPTDLNRLERAIVSEHLRIRRQRSTDIPQALPQTAAQPSRSERSAEMRWGLLAGFLGLVLLGTLAAYVVLGRLPSLDDLVADSGGEAVTAAAAVADSAAVVPAVAKKVETVSIPQKPERSVPRLVLQEATDDGGEDISLGVAVAGAAEGASAIVSGLARGTTISAGRPWGATGWIVPAEQLGSAKMRPPQGFASTMEYTIALHLPDNTVVARQAMRLDWRPAGAAKDAPAKTDTAAATTEPTPPPPPPAAAKMDTPAKAEAPAKADAPAQVKTEIVRADTRTEAAATPTRRLEQSELAVMLERGEKLLETGDFASARLLLQRAAEAGNARAALALGATYDPTVLSRMRVYGARPDVEKARAWYEKAREYGSREAPQRLELLASSKSR